MQIVTHASAHWRVTLRGAEQRRDLIEAALERRTRRVTFAIPESKASRGVVGIHNERLRRHAEQIFIAVDALVLLADVIFFLCSLLFARHPVTVFLRLSLAVELMSMCVRVSQAGVRFTARHHCRRYFSPFSFLLSLSFARARSFSARRASELISIKHTATSELTLFPPFFPPHARFPADDYHK